MTPQEKANELFYKFSRTHVLGVFNTKGKLISPYSSGYASIDVRNIRAKQCALIAVDEIIFVVSKYNDTQSEVSYWQEVQQELTKQQEQ
jgi:hypothetical protein